MPARSMARAGGRPFDKHAAPYAEETTVEIQGKVQDWQGIARSHSEFKTPKYVEQAVVGITVHTDGF